MKKIMAKWLNEIWYKDFFIGTWLVPFSLVYIDVMRFRRWLYKTGRKQVTKLSVPVIIVGNITVGGTGKTPLVIFLAEQLKAAGFKVGVISRGYGGTSEQWPQLVDKNSEAQLIGDEPLLMARHLECPIAVSPIRAEAGQYLIDELGCDVIISDDGLQHYALARDIEIAVIDGERRFGNNFYLPAGPLREPQERLAEVDFIVCNGGEAEIDEIAMQLEGDYALNMQTQERRALSTFKGLNCYALAGIGHPERFFTHLAQYELEISSQAFPDHYNFTAKDIMYKAAEAIFMTEKDAVKCQAFASDKHWTVPVKASLPSDFSARIIQKLSKT